MDTLHYLIYFFLCFTELVKGSWTHLHVKWQNTGDMNVFLDGETNSIASVICGNIVTPLSTARIYSLGKVFFPIVYLDNLALWLTNKSPFIEPWNHIVGKGTVFHLRPDGINAFRGSNV